MGASRFDDIIDSLKRLQQEIPDSLSLKGIKQDIGNTIKNINSPLLIMVMGEFSTGKSTFINALVGQDIAKVDANPTTAVITMLVYGTEDQITVVFRDGSRKGYDADSFAKLTAEADDESNELHEKMDYVERAMPLDILKSMSIIDSPGLNSNKAVHEETTRRFMDNADTVIWMFDAHNPGKQTEIDALKRLNPRLSPLVIVNQIDVIDEDEGDSVEQVITGVERTLRNNKLEAQRIIGVSAKMAVQGKKNNNEKLRAASNIDEFYSTINTVILPRYEVYKRNSLFDGLAKIIFRVKKELEHNPALNSAKPSLQSIAKAFKSRLDSFHAPKDILFPKFTGLFSKQPKQTEPSCFSEAEKTFLSVFYWFGLGTSADKNFALQTLEESARLNDQIAQTILADIYFQQGDIEKSIYWIGQVLTYNDKDELYDAETLYRIARFYDSGVNGIVEQNNAKAMIWYRRAAESGHPGAMGRLGYMYEKNRTISADGPDITQWYWHPSEFLDSNLLLCLGVLYEKDNYAFKNYAKAAAFYQKAADDGNINAMYSLAKMYREGRGVPQSEIKAKALLQKIEMIERG